MARSHHTWFLLALAVLIPVAAAAAWYGYWPVYHRKTLLAAAEKAMAEGNNAKAEEALQQLVKEEPDNMRGHFLYAQVLRRLSRGEEADIHLGKAGELGLPAEDGRRELGLIYATLDFRAAEGALKATLREHPDDAEVLKALVDGLARQGRFVETERYFKRLLELQPDNVEILLDRATMYISMEQFDKAQADLRALLQRVPDQYRAHLLLSHCLLAEARITEAEPVLLKCKEMRPESPDPLIGLAACAMEREDFVKAHTLLDKAIQLDPGSIRALNEIANIQMYRGVYDLAIPYLQRILKFNKNDKEAHLKLAQCFRFTGKVEEAKEHQARYEELDEEELRRQHRLPGRGVAESRR
jgi:Flp pilus assembly protein TadD